MSSAKNNKNKKKTNINSEKNNVTEENAATQENLHAELEKYLKITEGEIKNQQEKDENAKKTKKIYDEKLEALKILRTEGKIEDIYSTLIDLNKIGHDLEQMNFKYKIDIQNFHKGIKIYDDQNVALNKKIVEYEKYNKTLLERVKEMTEEKNVIHNEESEKFETIRNKCEEFKQDVIGKFEVTDTDIIRKENETLREKLTEYKEHSKMIEESIRAQMDFKEKQFSLIEDGLTSQINPKLFEFDEQNEKLKNENEHLKIEFNENLDKINQLQEIISKFHSNFEIGKKEFEKKAGEIFRLSKENKELRSLDPTNLINDNQIKKRELDILVSENKKLSEQITNFKELLK